MQRSMRMAYWGPLLDHGIGFNFDCWNHFMESGDKAALERPYPRLKRFCDVSAQHHFAATDCCGGEYRIPVVWLDHVAYTQQSHKHCAFNLTRRRCSSMRWLRLRSCSEEDGESYRQTGRELERITVEKVLDKKRKIFVAGEGRLCDRSLATAIIFDQCPGGETAAALKALVECPGNGDFVFRAMRCGGIGAGQLGRQDVILDDLRKRWPRCLVTHNNTVQKLVAEMDSTQQFSHARWHRCPSLAQIIENHILPPSLPSANTSTPHCTDTKSPFPADIPPAPSAPPPFPLPGIDQR